MSEDERYVRKLIQQYFYQLSVGCDNPDCTEPECRSCRNFSHVFNNPNEIAAHAIELTLNHPFQSHLCTSQNPYKVYSSIRNQVNSFNEIIFSLSRGSVQNSQISIISGTIFSVLSSESMFPFILLANDNPLTFQNLALSNEILVDLITVVQKSYKLFMAVDGQYHAMVRRLISTSNPSSAFHIRGLLLIFIFDIFFNTDSFQETLVPLLNHILNLPFPMHSLFCETLQNYPVLLKQVFHFVQTQFTLFILTQKRLNSVSKAIRTAAQFITLIRDISSNTINPIPSYSFSNYELSKRLDISLELESFISHRFSFLNTPAILTLKFKHKALLSIQEDRQGAMAVRTALNELFLNRRPINTNILYNVLEIRRDHLIEDAIRKIPNISPDDLSKKLMVIFTGEQGVDRGGVSREFFYLLINQLFSPDYGMFVNYGRFYWFSAFPLEDNAAAYETMGTVVALAIYNNVVLPIRFPLLLYKKILNKPISLNDIAEVDIDFVTGVRKLYEMRDRGENIEELMMAFSTTVDVFGELREVPLIPGGEKIDVTNQNLDAYVSAYVKWFSETSVLGQYIAFIRGFMKISNSRLFMLFAPDELDILVSGEPIFDWGALKKNAKYVDGYNAQSQVIRWFWEVFDEMTEREKTQFLRFSTGSDRAPIGGLGEVALTIQKTSNTDMLPVSHTCFNMFSLPAYSSKEILRDKVLLAIEHTEGFGLI